MFFSLLPPDFVPSIYILIHKDLNLQSEQEAINHYLTHGIKEKRKYRLETLQPQEAISTNFMLNYNKITTPVSVVTKQQNQFSDSKSKTTTKKKKKEKSTLQQDIELLDFPYFQLFMNYQHTIAVQPPPPDKTHSLSGQPPSKIKQFSPFVPSDFDPLIYRVLNKDLSRMSNQYCFEHYYKFGGKEKRKYELFLPPDFNIHIYQTYNLDLKDKNVAECVVHYNEYGKHEKRTYRLYPTLSELRNSYNHITSSITIDKFKFLHNNQNKKEYHTITPISYQPVYSAKLGINVMKKIKDCILVFDLSLNYAGGTKQFMDYILQYYCNGEEESSSAAISYLLIVRPCSKKYDIFLNQVLLVEKMNYQNIIYFIQQSIPRIKHIFINNLTDYPVVFKKFIYGLPIRKIVLTHDYSFLCDVSNPTVDYIEKNKENEISSEFVRGVDLIITQHQTNLPFYNYMSNITNKHIVVCELPDFKKTLSSFVYNENQQQQTIAFIGNISYIKGGCIVEKCCEKYSEKYKLCIIGNTPLNCIQSHEYRNIDELNLILMFTQPSLLVFCSIWSETYSYTLSLAMLTNIPIALYDVGNTVMKNRLEESGKEYYLFAEIEELDDIMSRINTKQCYLIKNEIDIPCFYDNVFAMTIQKNMIYYENVVLITSKIIINDKVAFTYSGNRSVYTADERYLQTLKTIKSVRENIPDSFVILFDNSELGSTMCNELCDKVDMFINVKDDKLLNLFTDYSDIKLYGELIQTHRALQTFSKLNIKFKHFFKISGRYYLNENFNYSFFNNGHNIFRQNTEIKNRFYYYTCLYKIHHNYFEQYKQIINKLTQEYSFSNVNDMHVYYDLETILPIHIRNFQTIDLLGITQLFSVTRNLTYA